MNRLEHLKILWSLLKNHKIHFLTSIFLIIGNSVIMGGVLSGVLPVMNSLLSPAGTGGDYLKGYFGKIITLYREFLPESEYKQLISLGMLFIIIMINTVIQFIIIKVNSGLTVKLTCDCRERIYNRIQHMKSSVRQQYSRGMLTQLLITETRSVYAVFKQVLNVTATFFNISIVITLLVMLSWKLSAVLMVGSLLLVLINLMIIKRIKQFGKTALSFRAILMNQATEAIWGLKQIKLIQAESVMADKLNTASKKSENMARLIMIKQGFQSFLSSNFTIGIIFTIILFWLFFPAFSEGIPETVGLITFLIFTSRLTPYFASISKEYGTIFANIPAVVKVNKFLSAETDMEISGTYRPDPLLKNKIRFSDVSFEYDPHKPVLQGINLEINKGSYTGIEGRSGGGKSTIFNLFTRIYDPSSGDIYIDGVNVCEFDLSYLRSHIGMVSQDYFLFNTTIRENLLLVKPDAPEHELFKALERAGLLEFVNSLDENLDTPVGNNGERLSEGQRQRLCLAFIFLQNPDIIILDEGTSSVDKKTENHILASIRELHRQGKTVISSSHRESALVDAERIYYLDKGKLSLVSKKAASP